MFEDFQIFLNSFVIFFGFLPGLILDFSVIFYVKIPGSDFFLIFLDFFFFFLDFFLEIFVITEIFRTFGKESMLKNNLCVGCVFYFQQWTLGANISSNI